MLGQVRMMTQVILLTLGVAFGSQLPLSPTMVLALVLVGAAALLPFIPWMVSALAGVLPRDSHGPTDRAGLADSSEVRLPGAPGTRGSALARAPSSVVHAHA